jgi:hypothetical protein
VVQVAGAMLAVPCSGAGRSSSFYAPR